jgi:hypothetical protein
MSVGSAWAKPMSVEIIAVGVRRQFISGLIALASLNLTRRDFLPTLIATLTTIAFDESSP